MTEKTYVRRPAKCSEGLTYQLNLLRKIHDSHLVKYAPYEIFEQDPDILYIASEYCILGSLKEKLYYHHQMQQPPSEDLMDKYFVGIVRGLAFLHTHSPEIIHGRLKPSNVLFHGDDVDTPRLADFGLFWKGKSLLERKREDVMYFSPEIIDKMVEGSEGAEMWGSTGADMWAVGCILYELMSMGEPAFKGSTFEEISSLVKRGKYRRMNPIWSTTDIFKQMNRMFFDVKIRPPAKILMCEIKGDSMFCSKCKQMIKPSPSIVGPPPSQQKGKECESKTPPLCSTGRPASTTSEKEKDIIIAKKATSHNDKGGNVGVCPEHNGRKATSDNHKGGNAGVGPENNGRKATSDNRKAKVVAEQPLYRGRRCARDERIRTEISKSDPLTSTKLLSPSLPQPCSTTTSAQSSESNADERRAPNGKSQSPESTPRRASTNPRGSTSWYAPNTSDEKPPEAPSNGSTSPESPLYPREFYPGDIDPRFEFTPDRRIKPPPFWLHENEKAGEEGEEKGGPKKSENYDGRHQVDKMQQRTNGELGTKVEDKDGREAFEGGGDEVSRGAASHLNPRPSQGGKYDVIAPTGPSSLSTTMEQASSSQSPSVTPLTIPLEREGIVEKHTHGAAPCFSATIHATRGPSDTTSFPPINLDASPPPRAQEFSSARNKSASALTLSPVNSSFSSIGAKFLFPHVHNEVGRKERPLPHPKGASSPAHYGKNVPPSEEAVLLRPHEKKRNRPPPPPPAALPPSQNPSMSNVSSSGRINHSPLSPPPSRHPTTTSVEKPLTRETDFIFLQPATKGQCAQEGTEGEAQPSCILDGARQPPHLGAVQPTETSEKSASAATTYVHTLLGSPRPPPRAPTLTSRPPLFQTTPQARAYRHENDTTPTATGAPPSHHAPRNGAQQYENDATPAAAATEPTSHDVARARLSPEVPPLDLTTLLAPTRLDNFRPRYIHTSTPSTGDSNWAAPTPSMDESRWAPTPSMVTPSTPAHFLGDDEFEADDDEPSLSGASSLFFPKSPSSYYGEISNNTYTRPRHNHFPTDRSSRPLATGVLVEHSSSFSTPALLGSHPGDDGGRVPIKLSPYHFTKNETPSSFRASSTPASDVTLLALRSPGGWMNTSPVMPMSGGSVTPTGEWEKRGGGYANLARSFGEITRPLTPIEGGAKASHDKAPQRQESLRSSNVANGRENKGDMSDIKRVEPASVSPAPRYDASKRSPILPYRENGINTMSSSTSVPPRRENGINAMRSSMSAPPYQRATQDSYSRYAANGALSSKFKAMRTALDTMLCEVGKLRRYNATPPAGAARAPVLGSEKKDDDPVCIAPPRAGKRSFIERESPILSKGREEPPILPTSISPRRSPFPTFRDRWSNNLLDSALLALKDRHPPIPRRSTCTRRSFATTSENIGIAPNHPEVTSESIGIAPNHPQIFTHRWGTDRPPLFGRTNNTTHYPSMSRSISRDRRPLTPEYAPERGQQKEEEERSGWWHIGGRYLAASGSLPGRYGAGARSIYSENTNMRGFSTSPRPLTDTSSPFCASSKSTSPARTRSFSPQIDAYTSRNTHRASSTIPTCMEPMRFSESMIRKHHLSVRPPPTSTRSAHTRAWANIGNSSSSNNNNNSNFTEASQPLLSSRSQPPTLNEILQSVDRKINRIMQNSLLTSSNYDPLKTPMESQRWYDSASTMMSASTSASTFGSSSGSSFGAHLSPHISSHAYETNRYSTRGRAKSHQCDKKKVRFPMRAGDLAETTEYIIRK